MTKYELIKKIRAVTGIGLAEAKDFLEDKEFNRRLQNAKTFEELKDALASHFLYKAYHNGTELTGFQDLDEEIEKYLDERYGN